MIPGIPQDMRTPILTVSALLCSACVQFTAPAAQPGPPATAPSSAADPGSGACPILRSSNWAAWVNAMPGPGSRPTLIVTGQVMLPTGGYSFDWSMPLVAESDPVQVTVILRPIRPEMATQAITTQEVRGSWPSGTRVGKVTVRCGDRTVAEISPVNTVR